MQKHPMNLFKIAAFMLSAVLFFSCEKEETPAEIVEGQFDHGIFITNEGPFMSGTGTVTFSNPQKAGYIQNLYEAVNQSPLGNIVQSMTIINKRGYIVVNNANKLEVVDMTDFKHIATIEGLTLPRYVVQVNAQEAFVSCWNNTVARISLVDHSILGNIPCGTGPEQMLKAGDYVYVLNQGGFANDSLITVIDIETMSVKTTLNVGVRPSGIVEDKNGLIWVLCAGKGYNGWPQPDDSPGELISINPVGFQITVSDLSFDPSVHPDKLVINGAGDMLYYLYNSHICKRAVTSKSSQPEAFASHSGSMYALGYDVYRNRLLFSDPVDYVQDGWVYAVDPVSGQKSDSLKAGIIPGNFCFNP